MHMHGSRQRLRTTALGIAAGMTLLSACGETTPSTAPSPSLRTRAVAPPSAAQASLTDLTRAVALALGHQGLRAQLRNDLRDSRVTVEHKLHLADYLKGRNGGALLAAMARETGRSRTELLADVAALRAMEIYMPVAAHRESWTGGADLLVASQLVEEEDPIGFQLDGAPVALSNAHVPATPTFVIVPLETDFATPLPQDWENSSDPAGNVIGTYRRAPGGSPGGVSAMAIIDPCYADPTLPECAAPLPPPPAPGTYLDYSYIDDLGESWVRGHPEIEVHLIAPTAFATSAGEHLSCSGETRSTAKRFDQNVHIWKRSSGGGGALFFRTDYDVYYVNYTANKPIGYQFWEDDDTPCVIKGTIGRDELLEFYDQMRRIYRATSIIVEILNPTTWVFKVGDATTISAMFQSDDDFIGTAVDQTSLGYSFTDATHVLMRPLKFLTVQTIDYNGRVRLINITR